RPSALMGVRILSMGDSEEWNYSQRYNMPRKGVSELFKIPLSTLHDRAAGSRKERSRLNCSSGHLKLSVRKSLKANYHRKATEWMQPTILLLNPQISELLVVRLHRLYQIPQIKTSECKGKKEIK
ncbi:hypothetical protein L9F63_000108, partial [Diploptera punctata]